MKESDEVSGSKMNESIMGFPKIVLLENFLFFYTLNKFPVIHHQKLLFKFYFKIY